MDNIKAYIIQIIIVASIVQLGGLLVSGKSYQKLYKLVGAIFLMLTMFSLPKANLKQIVDNSINHSHPDEVGADYISTEFTQKVSEKIRNSIQSQYGIESEVTVTTDESYTAISIHVLYDGEIDPVELKQYVIDNFCTQNDEVIVVGKKT
jgi:hypothetical protein